MIIIILLSIVVITLAYHYYVQNSKKGRLINLIPGPKPIPFFGNILEYQGTLEELWVILKTVTDKYYPIVKIWSFFTPAVSIRHPDDLEIILNSTKHISKGLIYNIMRPWFNDGLLLSDGAKWQLRRKILTPAFHFKILQQFVEILIEEGQRMAQSLKDVKGEVVKDLLQFTSEHTLNAICETAMGTSLQGLGAFQYQYRQAVYEMSEVFIYRLLRPWFHNDISFLISPLYWKQRKNLKILHGFTEKIIKERKLYHERTNGQYLKSFEDDATEISDTEVIGVRRKRLAMLDVLIAAAKNNRLTDLDIREEVDIFMFEGHDTTATGIFFALLLLAEHKEIQDRVRAEITTVMQENDGKLNMSSLQNLPYLDRCLKESLRLYPSVFFISRNTAEEVKLNSYIVPANTILHLNIYQVHRDPNFWPNPEVFDPDRFMPELIQKRHPYSYIPFSAGPRNCIGQRFALLEMKAMIAPLLYNFYLEPTEKLKDIKIMTHLVIRPNHSVYIKFIPIESHIDG